MTPPLGESALVHETLPAVVHAESFPKDQLESPVIERKGGTVLSGNATLCRIPGLEGKLFLVPADLLMPNPDQPRDYFDPGKMDELTNTLRNEGQQVAISVVPIETPSGMRLFIIDGERRFRALTQNLGKSEVMVKVDWVSSAYELLLRSLILNESKADHNPVERAKTYRQLLDELMVSEGINQGEATKKLAEHLGISASKISNHLRLLLLDPEIQAQVATGRLPTQAALQFANTRKRLGDALMRDASLARLVIDDPEGLQKDDGDKAGELSHKGLQRGRRRALLEGDDGDKEIFNATGALHRLSTVLSGTQRAATLVLESDPATIVEIQRARQGKPPEAVLAEIHRAVAALLVLEDVVQRAARPDLLVEMPGKPAFEDFIAKSAARFVEPLRHRIALELAKASDSKLPTAYTAAELAEALGQPVQVVANHLSRMKRELERLDLEMIEEVRRVQTGKSLDKVPAYRLMWKDQETAPDLREWPTVASLTKKAAPKKGPKAPARVRVIELGAGGNVTFYYPQESSTLKAADVEEIRAGAARFGLEVEFTPLIHPEAGTVVNNGAFQGKFTKGGEHHDFSHWVADLKLRGLEANIEL